MARDITNTSANFVYTRDYVTSPPNHSHPFTTGEVVTTCQTNNNFRGDVVHSDFRTPTAYGCQTLRRTPKYFELTKNGWTLGYHYGYFWYKEQLSGLKAPSTTIGALDTDPYDARFSDHHSAAAISQCLQKILNNGFDMGEALSEVRSNASLIADLLEKAGEIIRAWRSSNPRHFAEAISFEPSSVDELAGKAADVYLGVKFGITPLIESIWHAAEAIREAFDSNQDNYLSAFGESSGVDSPNGGTDNLVYSFSGELDVGSKVGVTYQVTDSAAHALAALRISNPLTTAWAALPLSFVLDWFLHVGQVLSGLTAPIGLTFHSGYESRWRRGTFTATEDRWTYWDGWSGTYPSVDVEVNAFARRPLAGFPVPSVYFTFDLDAGQLVTAMALIKQRG